MRITATGVLILTILAIPGLSGASDLATLATEGYRLVEETRIIGEFKGCLASAPLRFTNGKVFLCTTFGYDNLQYMPVVSIFKNREGAIKILIHGKEYSGSFADNP